MRKYLLIICVCFSSIIYLRAEKVPKIKIDSEKVLERISNRIKNEFDLLLKKPEEYKQRAIKECSLFPEGTIYPFIIPALGYANIAIRNLKEKAHCIEQMRKLIDLAIPYTAEMTKPPYRDLMKLKDYKKHATYLSTLNLGLSSYEYIAGDGRYSKLNNHISKLLYNAIKKMNGRPISSYPHYSWNFDTNMALSSLAILDKTTGKNQTEEIAQKHFQWIEKHCLHNETKLPFSIGWDNSPEAIALPRGCDLSMRICLLGQVNRKEADKLYQQYIKWHWIDLGRFAGFSEWPKGMQQNYGDVDSGPVIMEIGLTATGMGVGAALVAKDKERLNTLCAELLLVEPMIALAANKQAQKLIPPVAQEWSKVFTKGINPEYFSGFLYGDAVLFYALTWIEYPAKNKN